MFRRHDWLIKPQRNVSSTLLLLAALITVPGAPARLTAGTAATSATVQLSLTGASRQPLSVPASVWYTQSHSPHYYKEVESSWTTAPANLAIPVDIGQPLYIKATAPGHATLYRRVIPSGTALTRPVELQLTPGVTVHGKLLSTDGAITTTGTISAIYNLMSLEARQGRLGNHITELTDFVSTTSVNPNGTFTFAHLPAGEYEFILDAPGFTTRSYEFDSNIVGVPDGDTATIEVACLPLGFLAGRVTAENGKPVSGARVSVCDDQDWRISFDAGQTDADGNFHLHKVPHKSWYLEVHVPGKKLTGSASGEEINRDNLTVVVKPVSDDEENARHYSEPESTATLPLKYEAVIHVEDPATRQPIKDFTTEIVNVASFIRWEVQPGDGAFTVKSSERPMHQHISVRVTAPGRTPVVHHIREEGVATVRLPEPARLSGVVIAADTGEPIADVELSSEVWPSISTITDSRGQFHFDGYPAGISDKIRIRPSAAHLTTETTVQLTAGEGTSITLVLKPNAHFRIRLVQEPGAVPVAGEQYQFGGGSIATATTLRGLPQLGLGQSASDGTLSIYSQDTDARLWLPQRQLEVTIPLDRANRPQPLDIILGSSAVTVKIANDDKTFYDASVTSCGLHYRYGSDYHRQEYLIRTDSNGNAHLRDLAPGQWTIKAPDMNQRNLTRPARQKHTITIPADGVITTTAR